MKFTTVIVFLAASVYAQSNSTTNSTAPPADDPSLKCLRACNDNDTSCRAKCVGVPNPTDKMANSTVDCVSKCNQNDTNAFTKCRDSCINNNFLGDRPSAPAPGSKGDKPSDNSTDGNKTESSGSFESGHHYGLLSFVGAVVLVNAL